jgi:hypothetical protein
MHKAASGESISISISISLIKINPTIFQSLGPFGRVLLPDSSTLLLDSPMK